MKEQYAADCKKAQYLAKVLILSFLAALYVTGCKKEEPALPEEPTTPEESGIDIDLTTVSSILVYSEVTNIMSSPDAYIGKTVKLSGLFDYFKDETTGKEYFSCIIQDSTACCTQGIEFVWEGVHVYPDDYPMRGDEITVTGTFGTYEEDGYLYGQLSEAKLEAESIK